MKKRITSLLLVLAMCFAMLPTAAFAAEDKGGSMPAYSGGSGTHDNPWLITSQEDLIALAVFLNSGNAKTFDTEAAGIGNCHGYYFKQTADIDLTGVSWEPIGYSGSYYFAGNYDADGHSITNAVSTGKVDPDGFATAGIFGWVAFGSVENLHVKNANFVATGQNNYSYVGGIAGVCYGSSIKNCSVVNSSLESKRNNNNNCAGSIVGFSTGGTFEKCAAENNQVKTMAYGGGFVGEVDDDPKYGAGTSTFTNCYTANCSVSSKTDDVQGVSLVGGFVGEMTDSALTVNNCYVYRAMLSTEETAVPGIKATGVFAGHLWSGSSIVNTNCFFGACGTTENAGTASEKTEEEFRNGTVAELLGKAFAQVGDYPKINGPADYSSVDAAIAKANALNKDNYKDFSAVEAAVDAVVRDKKITEQPVVDAMAEAIEYAIDKLQYKDADYTKVDEALAKAKALNKNSYQDFSAVEKAIDDVVRDKNITEQYKVDAMAKAIEDAIAGLVSRSSSSGSSKPSYSVTAPGATENGSVTVSPKNATKGSTVTVTVKPDDGYQLDKLTVADAKGGTISVTDKGNGKYTFTMPASKVTVTPIFVKIAQQPTGKTFSDVAKSDWFADAVAYVTDKGLMNGTGSDTFSPSASTTRGMLMTVLARYAGEDTTGGAIWYEKGMNWAKAKGVSDGTNPEVNITREQLVTMLYRYAGSPKANGSLDSFSDAASVSSYAVNAMQWAVANGIVNGSNGKLNPQNNATRAEVAAILMRFCEMSK